MTKTQRPEWATEYPDYEQMVAAWGAVREFITCGDWHGDHVVLISNDSGRIGFSVIGYGSCSGCDALQAVTPWDEDGDWQGVVDLARELRDEVVWFDNADELAAYIDHRAGSDWWAHDDEVMSAVRKCVETAREATR